MLLGSSKSKFIDNKSARPFCECFRRRDPVPWQPQVNVCSCGEDVAVREWRWQQPEGDNSQSWVVFDDNQKQVTFHPFYSSGTAAVRGDSAFDRDHHYYWEIKMMTDTYGTDIMVGVGTEKVNIADSRFKFTSLLGEDEQSYGLSYRGAVRHGAARARESAGFCRGTIVGVRVDMWQGTLEFYLNRKPQGISFYNLRRHQHLFPMVCSTAAQSTMRLIYAASWRASLFVDAAKILAASATAGDRANMPPGLWRMFQPHFWLLMPTEDPTPEKSEDAEVEIAVSESLVSPAPLSLVGEVYLVIALGLVTGTVLCHYSDLKLFPIYCVLVLYALRSMVRLYNKVMCSAFTDTSDTN